MDLVQACNDAILELNPDSDGVKKRQVYYDIRFMESDQGWSIDLEKTKKGRTVYYRYADPHFSINNQPLNASTVDKIRHALQVLTRFSGAPQFGWVSETIPMLEEMFELKSHNEEVINFQNNIDLQGVEYLIPLFNAINNQRVLYMKYQPFNAEKGHDFIFHPHYLKQYNNRWFVFGLNADEGIENWAMALDRIQHIEETDEDYIMTRIDWGEYFDDMIGVTKLADAEIETVILLFNEEAAPYIKTKPLHLTQKSYETENGLEVHIQVIPNFELQKLILSYGNQVEVLKPDSLRWIIASRTKAAYDQYWS